MYSVIRIVPFFKTGRSSEGAILKTVTNYTLPLILILLLSACAGSGNSAGSTSANPFSVWNVLSSGSSATLMGGSSVVTLDQTVSQYSSGASASISFDAGRNVSSLSFVSANGTSASFNVVNGDQITSNYGGSTVVASNNTKTQMAILANPYYMGYDYQTYGAWGAYGSSTTSSYGVSLGSATPGSSIPSNGTGTFVGGMAGYYTDIKNNGYLVFANMTATVDFAARQVNLTTANTALVGMPIGASVSASGLNMTGSLAYGVSSNKLTGTFTTTNGMTGNASGQFYGPSANEVGGTFAATSSTQGTLVGGFGGKR